MIDKRPPEPPLLPEPPVIYNKKLSSLMFVWMGRN